MRWDQFRIDMRSADAPNPSNEAGVYEVRESGSNEKRLYIGKASNLRMRVKQGLVGGQVPHTAGRAIEKALEERKLIDIEVRWAPTERPAAAEEELHLAYRGIFKKWPKFVKHAAPVPS